MPDTATMARNSRVIATVLDTLPEGIEPPTHLYADRETPQIAWLIFGGEPDQKARAAAIVRALGGKWDKAEQMDLFRFETERLGADLRVVVDRAQVCRRVVTGTRTITKHVPAPDAPTVEVTETVESVQWVCDEPLLSVTA